MPYFFVDGTRNNQPAPALYVEADNADAALARAAQLGLEGTGVRPANDFSGVEPAKPWTILGFFLLLSLMSCLEMYNFQTHGKSYPYQLPVQFIMLGMVFFRGNQTILGQAQKQQLMQAEIRDLQLALEQIRSSQR